MPLVIDRRSQQTEFPMNGAPADLLWYLWVSWAHITQTPVRCLSPSFTSDTLALAPTLHSSTHYGRLL